MNENPIKGIPTDFEFNKLARRCYDQDKEIYRLQQRITELEAENAELSRMVSVEFEQAIKKAEEQL